MAENVNPGFNFDQTLVGFGEGQVPRKQKAGKRLKVAACNEPPWPEMEPSRERAGSNFFHSAILNALYRLIAASLGATRYRRALSENT
jgi:hypothetical protein